LLGAQVIAEFDRRRYAADGNRHAHPQPWE